MEEVSIKEWQDILLDEACVFHEICVKHNIPYYMLGGTMLGAIRHQGFIPWDDDMDFGVMQEDFVKLRDILKKELPSNYQIRDEKNIDFYYGRQVKIENIKTISIRRNNKGDQLGAFIDIFPLVRTNGKKNLFSRNGLISFLLKLQYYRFGTYKTRKKKTISLIVKIFMFWLKQGLLSNIVIKYLEKDKGDFIVNYWGAWINKELVHHSIMGTPKLYKFENKKLYGVEKPEEYLKSLYGDYMKIPQDHSCHLSKMYIKHP